MARIRIKVQPHEVKDFPLSTIKIDEKWLAIINAGNKQ